MASPSLIDVDAVDLSRVIHGKDVIRRYCKQRGRLGVRDGSVYEDVPAGLEAPPGVTAVSTAGSSRRDEPPRAKVPFHQGKGGV